jgi:hypothetical protein
MRNALQARLELLEQSSGETLRDLEQRHAVEADAWQEDRAAEREQRIRLEAALAELRLQLTAKVRRLCASSAHTAQLRTGRETSRSRY